MGTSGVYYVGYALVGVWVLRMVNEEVGEGYMDEPFHVGQATAYCNGNWTHWDNKITTPPGTYLLSIALQRVFLLRCSLQHLRFTILLALLALPLLLTRLLRIHLRLPPPRTLLEPTFDAIVISTFPVLWFFGFLYYTDVPSVAVTLAAIIASRNEQHALAAFLGLLSCLIRQNNIIWILYAFAYSQLAKLRFKPPKGWSDKMFRDASLWDLSSSLLQLIRFTPHFIKSFIPYATLLALFVGFVFYNGGVALGDRSNHELALHIPQIYYFWAFATLLGWPVLVSRPGGLKAFAREISRRLLGDYRALSVSLLAVAVIASTSLYFLIEHPFLLSDNRHYTFYVWRRIFRLHPLVPALLAPGYLFCFMAWMVRVGDDQTILQTILLPLATIPVLVLPPLLEPRYFVMPYILLRVQVTEYSLPGLVLELLWYSLVNWVTMHVFLYYERLGVGRFTW